jgi:hypothetical protein
MRSLLSCLRSHNSQQIVASNTQVLADPDAMEERDRQLPAEMPAPIPRTTRLQQKEHKGSTKNERY